MIGVFSCQKEDDSFIKQEHTSQTSKTKYSITKIDYQTVQQNNRLVNSITKIKEQTGTKGSSTQNRLVHSSAYGFYIDTDVATYMENANGSYHSYTFPIFRDNPTIALENLLFSLQEDGTYKVSIVSYDITESEREALLNRQYIDLTNKIAKEDIDGLELVDDVFNKEVQTSFTWSYVCECDISEHIGGVDPNTGNLCNCVGIQISITNGTGENNDGNNPGGFPDNNENPHEYPDNSDVPEGENNPGGGVPNDTNNNTTDATSPTYNIPYEQNLIECLGLNSVENANLVVSNWINNPDNFFQMRDVSSYVDRNNCSTEAQSFAMEAIEAMNNGEVESLGEYIALVLNEELEENPFLLLDIDCNQIQNWQSLAQHTAPQSVQDKIENLQENQNGPFGDWEIQQLEDANGTIVNLDYFSVNITQFPINPNTGQPFTPNQFIDYYRRNLNDFVDNTTFEPYCEISTICQQETNLWNSSNPLGAIVKLDIPLNDGVVVCADYNNEFWRFMTLEAPWDSNHPVSGTRQFGIEQMPNGSYNIYVRGVDRFTSNLQENAAYMVGLSNPFFAADNLWESFQENINQFINNNSGTSSINVSVHNRPDWDEVNDVLQGRKPISELGCN